MKSVSSALLLLALLPAVFAQNAPAPVPAAPPAPAPIPGIDPAATAVWAEHARGMGDRRSGRTNVDFPLVTSKAFEFFEKFPAERRVGGILINLSSFGDWLGDAPLAASLQSKWRQHLRIALAEALQKTWPDNVWSGLSWVALRNEIALRRDASAPADLPALRARIDAVVARAPASPYRVFMEKEYFEQLERNDPKAVIPFLTSLAQSDVTDVAALGNGQLAVQRLKTIPMELKFTAVDGTAFDLAALRGQVVLIDCWATWCVPCIKELPNIKAARAKWGDKGFSVVGISFDRVADRAKLEKFIADEELAWPHWFNEKGSPNPFGKAYNIRSIPATFLLDKDGLLVTTDTHGEKLEAALQKLLGP
jgi:thiol-disulfide isomerase/thioredoxin